MEPCSLSLAFRSSLRPSTKRPTSHASHKSTSHASHKSTSSGHAKRIAYEAFIGGKQNVRKRTLFAHVVEQGEDVSVKAKDSRHTSVLTDRLKLGKAVYEAREASDTRYWLNAYVHRVAPKLCEIGGVAKRKYTRKCASALKAYIKSLDVNSARGVIGRGNHHSGVRCSFTSAKLRRNFCGGGRPSKSMERSEELWHWFVDTIRNIKCRFDSNILIGTAEEIMETLRGINKSCRADHKFSDLVTLPDKINSVWIARWRKYYGITFRTRNICYTISRDKLKHRIGVFWRNVLRFRILWKIFHGTDAKFLSGDQKPFYFNANDSNKVLHFKGTRRVEAIENHAASRMRFSGMSLCLSWVNKDQEEYGAPKLAVLFKGIGTISLPAGHPAVTVQWGEKGSYRVQQVLEWLAFALPDSKVAVVCVQLDWYAAHLDSEVFDYIRSRGHHVIYLGGGITPWVQVPDSHIHDCLSQVFKSDERK